MEELGKSTVHERLVALDICYYSIFFVTWTSHKLNQRVKFSCKSAVSAIAFQKMFIVMKSIIFERYIITSLGFNHSS